MLGLGFKDTQCGFKAFNRRAIDTMFTRQHIERWGFDPELLFLAKKFRLQTTEVPVEWAHDHRSKINPLRDGLRMGGEVLKIRWNDWLGRYRKPAYAVENVADSVAAAASEIVMNSVPPLRGQQYGKEIARQDGPCIVYQILLKFAAFARLGHLDGIRLLLSVTDGLRLWRFRPQFDRKKPAIHNNYVKPTQQFAPTSVRLCAPLTVEDHSLQAMPDTSPAKWHLAHTTWFFETFLLSENLPGYRPFNPAFRSLFNSYYNAVGDRPLRSLRHVLSRPTLDEVHAYRAHVDEAMEQLLARDLPPDAQELVALGLNHEQQHQELILTDVKYGLAANPLRPAYREAPAAESVRKLRSRCGGRRFQRACTPSGTKVTGSHSTTKDRVTTFISRRFGWRRGW